MAQYRVTTDQGTFLVTTEDAAPPAEPSMIEQASQYASKTPEISTTPVGMGKQVAQFLSPVPTQMSDNNPISLLEGKRQFLEGAGRKVKDAFTGSVGNIVSKTSEKASEHLPGWLANQVQNASAIGGGWLTTAAEMQPFSPGDFAAGAAGAIMGPMLGSSKMATRAKEEIANRNLQAPKAIQEGRYMKGQKRVGEVALDEPRLAIRNKGKMYKESNSMIADLGNKIESKINEIFQRGKTPTNQYAEPSYMAKPYQFVDGEARPAGLEYKPTQVQKFEPEAIQPEIPGGRRAGVRIILGDKVETTQPGGATYETLAPGTGLPLDYTGQTPRPTMPRSNIRSINEGLNPEPSRLAAPVPSKYAIETQEIVDAVNPVIEEAAKAPNAETVVPQLMKLKDDFVRRLGPRIDFRTGNAERVRLGDNVGKGFNKDTTVLPEITLGERAMWTALRDRIGQMSPELDALLQRQHDLMDVRTAATPEAAKGYTKTPNNIVDWIKTPVRQMGIARNINALKNTGPSGAVLGTEVSTGKQGVAETMDKLMNNRKDKKNGR